MGQWKSQPPSMPPAASLVALLAAVGTFCSCHRRAPPAAAAAASLSQAAQQAPPPLADVPSLEACLREGNTAWPQRDERAQLEVALAAYERAYLLLPTDAALATKLSHGYFLLGHVFLRETNDKNGMHQAFGRGIVVAEMALRMSSAAFAARLARGEVVEEAIDSLERTAVAPLVAYTENAGAFAALRGRAASLFFAERLRATIERLLTLDPHYGAALPHRFMAIWYARMPTFAGGSAARAQQELSCALSLSHDAPVNLLAAVTFARKPLAERARLLAWLRSPAPSAPARDTETDAAGDEDLVYGAAEERLTRRQAAAALGVAAAP